MIKVSEVIQGYKDGIVPASTLIKMAAFKDELEKNAGPFFESMGRIFSSEPAKWTYAMGAASVGANAIHEGLKGLEGMYKDYKLSKEKMPAYEQMIQLHPELKDKEDRAMLYFDALWHFSLPMATNPLAAGAYIKQALQYDHVAQGPLPASIRELADISRLTSQAKEKSDGEGILGNVFMPLKTGPADVFKSTAQNATNFGMAPLSGLTKRVENVYQRPLPNQKPEKKKK